MEYRCSPHCVGHHNAIPWVHTATGMSTTIHPPTLAMEWLIIVTSKVDVPIVNQPIMGHQEQK